ncbi:cytochrome P450 [Mytilinidion resinicola]|uniref:Cytochrome P450 n=1 Tax=Mytilinidion resinicola TaxID=574789 RepID=A0A6A6Y1A7_9PEZI|nr:cytochrome P450 [Mytilinidion resinicola]KAF2802338.1 cytochrome P450 [Mytilinidion resinicola]
MDAFHKTAGGVVAALRESAKHMPPLSQYQLSAVLAALSTHALFQLHEFQPMDVLFAFSALNLGLRLFLDKQTTETGIVVLQAQLNLIYFVSLFTSIAIYRRFLHRTRQFPGPFLASITKWWAWVVVYRGEYHRTVRALHNSTKSDIVRVGPRELDICNVDFIGPLYGVGTKCIKGPWYEGTLMGSHHRFLQNEKPEGHLWKRRIWDAGFNSKSIREYEPHVLRVNEELLEKLKKLTKDGKPIDIGLYFAFFTWDIMGDLGFGESFDMINTGTANDAMNVVQGFTRFNSLVCTIPWCSTLFAWFPKDPKAEGLFTFAKERVKQRLPLGTTRDDIFTHLLREDRVSKKKYSDLELILESLMLTIGGSDTTSSSLATICYYLMANPSKYAKLKAEIHPYDGPLTHLHLAKFPYLNAVIREALRLLPPIGSGMMHRETPPEGLTVNGIHLPGNTSVGIGAYEIQRDARYYGNPDEFIPERWLGEGPEPFDRNAFLVFSYGPYSCVGKHLAYLELCDVIAGVVKTFDMEFAPGYDAGSYEMSIKDSVVSTRAHLSVILKARA